MILLFSRIALAAVGECARKKVRVKLGKQLEVPAFIQPKEEE